MNKTSLCIATLLTLSVAAHASTKKEVHTITGVTVSPANPVVGESVRYILTMSGVGTGECVVDWKASSSTKAVIGNAFASVRPGANTTIENNVVMQADTYMVKIEGSKTIANSTYPACKGEASISYTVTNPRIVAKATPNLELVPLITGLTVPDSVETGASNKLMLLGQGLCSYHVDFGDGKAEDRTDNLPIDLRSIPTHEYTNYGVPKTFTLKVKGAAGKCKGEFKKDVIVTAPNLSVAAPQETAIPANPTVKVACPPGKVC